MTYEDYLAQLEQASGIDRSKLKAEYLYWHRIRWMFGEIAGDDWGEFTLQGNGGRRLPWSIGTNPPGKYDTRTYKQLMAERVAAYNLLRQQFWASALKTWRPMFHRHPELRDYIVTNLSEVRNGRKSTPAAAGNDEADGR